MTELEILQSSAGQRFKHKLVSALLFVPRRIKQIAMGVPSACVRLWEKIKNGSIDFVERFKEGDKFVKLSYFVFGLGTAARGQIVKGCLFFAVQLMYILMIALPIFEGISGAEYIGKFFTLGTVQYQRYFDYNNKLVTIPGDNSTHILLFGVIMIVATAALLMVYLANTKSAYKNYITVKSGEKPTPFVKELKALLDEKFHITLLIVPIMGTVVMTILPLIFMISIAFTNYGPGHLPANQLFTWIGFNNFGRLFAWGGAAETFWKVFLWTVCWAFLATFSNYILGIIVAMLINKKGIKFKKLWRTILVITAAVPQFVTLLLMSLMLHIHGPINTVLKDMGLITESIDFLGNAWLARGSVLLVNVWVGIPYTMLITTGILLNIPADLYESAKIDGASVPRMFLSITMPYIVFVTTPYLISQFIGNLNNFNVIYLLTGGGPPHFTYENGAGQTDLLVTWLYKLTKDKQEYGLASAIGIIVFIISAVIALFTYSGSASYNKEEEFS